MVSGSKGNKCFHEKRTSAQRQQEQIDDLTQQVLNLTQKTNTLALQVERQSEVTLQAIRGITSILNRLVLTPVIKGLPGVDIEQFIKDNPGLSAELVEMLRGQK